MNLNLDSVKSNTAIACGVIERLMRCRMTFSRAERLLIEASDVVHSGWRCPMHLLQLDSSDSATLHLLHSRLNQCWNWVISFSQVRSRHGSHWNWVISFNQVRSGQIMGHVCQTVVPLGFWHSSVFQLIAPFVATAYSWNFIFFVRGS